MRQSNYYVIIFVIVMFALGFLTCTLFLQDPQGSQRSLLFPDQGDHFMDFFNTLNYSAARDPYHEGYGGRVNRNYLPLAYLIVYPFTKLGDYIHILPKELRFEQASIIGCFVYLMISFGSFFYLLYEGKTGRRLERLLVVLSCACSGLILYNIERANTVILSASALLMFLLFYRDERTLYRQLAFSALGIAAALKVYPAIFGILLFYEKRYKDIPAALFHGVAWVFLPFLFFDGGFQNIGLLIYNVQLNSEKYYGGLFSIVTNHLIEISFKPLAFYLANVIMIVVLMSAWLLKNRWKQILLLMCSLMLTPTHSGYYCGIYMFIPFLFFINEEEHEKKDILYLILFLVLFSPFQFYVNLPKIGILKSYLDNTMMQNMAVIAMYVMLLLEMGQLLIKKMKQWANESLE